MSLRLTNLNGYGVSPGVSGSIGPSIFVGTHVDVGSNVAAGGVYTTSQTISQGGNRGLMIFLGSLAHTDVAATGHSINGSAPDGIVIDYDIAMMWKYYDSMPGTFDTDFAVGSAGFAATSYCHGKYCIVNPILQKPRFFFPSAYDAGPTTGITSSAYVPPNHYLIGIARHANNGNTITVDNNFYSDYRDRWGNAICTFVGSTSGDLEDTVQEFNASFSSSTFAKFLIGAFF